MTRKNIGSFKVDGQILDQRADKLAEVLAMMRFVPVRCEFLWAEGRFEMVGLSPLFKPVDFASITPEYTIVCHNGDDGKLEKVTVELVTPTSTIKVGNLNEMLRHKDLN